MENDTDQLFSVVVAIAIISVLSIGSSAILQNTHAQVDCNANPNDPSCQQSGNNNQQQQPTCPNGYTLSNDQSQCLSCPSGTTLSSDQTTCINNAGQAVLGALAKAAICYATKICLP